MERLIVMRESLLKMVNCKDCMDISPLGTMKALLYRAIFPSSPYNSLITPQFPMELIGIPNNFNLSEQFHTPPNQNSHPQDCICLNGRSTEGNLYGLGEEVFLWKPTRVTIKENFFALFFLLCFMG